MNTKENSINIHEYPENATPIQLAEYQLEVMRAAERGEAVEMLIGDEWHDNDQPDWCWSDGCRYRIARPKIAEGHNPDKLTVDQVQVNDGWRLLSVEEAAARCGVRLSSVDWWSGRKWEVDGAGWWLDDTSTLRTRQPIGHYLPKPEPVKKEETPFDFYWASKAGTACHTERDRAVALAAWNHALDHARNLLVNSYGT